MLDPTKAILGTFGQAFIGGVWQTNINHLEANVEVEKRELKLSGMTWSAFKMGIKKGTGTMSGYKISSAMIEQGFKKFNIISRLDDPEAYGFERIELENCMVDKVQLANWTAGEEVTDETQFTFEGFTLHDKIEIS
ncbi:phage tail tube protein [Cohnella nanjingensis]|uniref:Phage tail tube protein n=1 Tax=Cohnella nanjingensis TaxID=1387779 RepID=A0A7X0RSP9_9BACL|nr:phage tail tube protein [Cohnella nanjingensis]MBB6673019.1 phage tail tube protein [Cohnella nanjingensis]